MLLKFTKMHGLGNDFVILDLISQRFNLRSRHVRKLADRHRGIGCDQLLVVEEAPRTQDAGFSRWWLLPGSLLVLVVVWLVKSRNNG